MPNFVVSFCQLITYFLFIAVFRFIRRIEKKLPENIKELKRGSLIVANHQSELDPYIVLSQIPFLVGLKILPIRFPVCDKYMNARFFSKLLPLLGCYNIGLTKKENMLALFYTRKLLREGETIFLFPEGGISRDDKLKEFKKGIEFLIGESKNVLFIKLQGFNEKKWTDLSEGRKMSFSSVEKFDRARLKTDDLMLFLANL